MQLRDALQIVYDALVQHCEDCIGTDKQAQADLDEAWGVVELAAKDGERMVRTLINAGLDAASS